MNNDDDPMGWKLVGWLGIWICMTGWYFWFSTTTTNKIHAHTGFYTGHKGGVTYLFFILTIRHQHFLGHSLFFTLT
ncbi:hypothetical protein QBC44DRAFT_336994 [Cladorrhinum sp. PSN332]|nr:hypothetical protein QBC44DRAFT_336994 [Cladorrhinum sp. PSN332]